MEGREEEVEEEAPVREDGEVGELVADALAASWRAAGVLYDNYARDEDVEALRAALVGSPYTIHPHACGCRVPGARRTHKDEAQRAKRGGGKDPRGHEALGGVPNVMAKGEGPEHGAHLAVQPRCVLACPAMAARNGDRGELVGWVDGGGGDGEPG